MLEGSIQIQTMRALRNEDGSTILTRDRDRPAGGAAPLGAQVTAVHRRQIDHQDQALSTEKDGKPSLKGWGGGSQKIAVVQTPRTTAMELTVFAALIINH